MFDKLIDLIIQFIRFFQFCHNIDQYQEGVVLRFGKFNRVRKPGLAFVWPFYIERMMFTSVVDEPIIVGPQSLTTSDGCQIVVKALFVIRITDVRAFMLDLEGASTGVLFLASGVLAELIQSHTWDELSKQEPDEDDEEQKTRRTLSVGKKFQRMLQRNLKGYGVQVLSGRLSELTKARTIRLMDASQSWTLKNQ